jgi:tRNA-intron lyase
MLFNPDWNIKNMAIQLLLEDGVIKATKPEDIEALRRAHYGVHRKGELILQLEDALYLIDVRNAKCLEDGKELSFNDLAQRFMRRKLFAEYATYKDWRERGLMVRPIHEAKTGYKKNPIVKYPSQKLTPPKAKAEGMFFSDDRIAVIEDPVVGRKLYDDHWFGQYGSYKAEERGRLLKLDKFETLFLMKRSDLTLRGMKITELEKELNKDPDFEAMYDVYDDWRMAGFVVKSGFKFGTHFRIYFPGASPVKSGEWVHSKHVLHVFPRTKRMIIAEWARAIRVAHGVRKTFILAIPGKKMKKEKEESETALSFLLYHRAGNGIETPDKHDPSFAMLSLSEDEMIGGAELARAIGEAKHLGLDLMLAIADRETAVTYYRVKRIELPGSKYEYYEIEWAQP